MAAAKKPVKKAPKKSSSVYGKYEPTPKSELGNLNDVRKIRPVSQGKETKVLERTPESRRTRLTVESKSKGITEYPRVPGKRIPKDRAGGRKAADRWSLKPGPEETLRAISAESAKAKRRGGGYVSPFQGREFGMKPLGEGQPRTRRPPSKGVGDKNRNSRAKPVLTPTSQRRVRTLKPGSRQAAERFKADNADARKISVEGFRNKEELKRFLKFLEGF